MSTTPVFNTSTFGDFVELADVIWIKELGEVDMSARNSGIFRVSPWPAGTGDDRNYKEFDTNQYAKNKDEGSKASQSEIQIGYNKHAGLVRRAENVGVTWEMRNRNKYDEAMQQITALPEKIAGRLDLDLSHRFTFMTATSFTDMDGKTIDTSMGDGFALGYSAHTVTGSSTTYRNILANNPQLSEGSLESIEKQAVENTIDNFGTKKSNKYTILWTTDDPNSVNTAKKILRSTATLGAPNEGVVNVNQQKYKHVILPRVATDANGAADSTKAKYWGIVAPSVASAYLSIEQEPTMIRPKVNGKELTSDNAEDVETDTVTWRGRGSYSICIVSGRGFQVSKGDGTA